MSDKKVLFITNQLPYPPSTGGKMKSWNLLKFISSHFNVGLITLLKDDEKSDEAAMLGKIELREYYSEELNIRRSALNLLKSYFLADSLNVFRNKSAKFYKRIEKTAADYDCIIVDHYDVYPAVLNLVNAKKILHQHNAEFCIWERLSEIESNPFKKLVVKIEANRIKKAEKKYAENANLIWAAPNDIEALNALGVSKDKFKITYHLGDDQFLNYPNLEFDQTDKKIVFVGTQTWEANIDGMLWFLESVWPKVKKAEPDTQLFIIGKNPSPRLTKFGIQDKNIIFTGFVEQLEDHFNNARVSIVPLRFGSGMKVKLLTSMFRGLPNVTTTIGAEGIEVEHTKHLFISDSDEKFAQHVIELMDNRKLWEKFRDASRGLAKTKYSWNSLLTKHKKEIEELIGQ